MITRAMVVAEARTWIGTPWHHQASRKGVGTDCRGILVGVARSLGLPEAVEFDRCRDYSNYGREPDQPRALRACTALLDPVATGSERPGDILYLHVPRVAHPMHFAIVADRGRMIHATVTAGGVVEHRLDEVWRSRIASCWSYRGLAD